MWSVALQVSVSVERAGGRRDGLQGEQVRRAARKGFTPWTRLFSRESRCHLSGRILCFSLIRCAPHIPRDLCTPYILQVAIPLCCLLCRPLQ